MDSIPEQETQHSEDEEEYGSSSLSSSSLCMRGSSSSSSSLSMGEEEPEPEDEDKMYVLVVHPLRMKVPDLLEFNDIREGMKCLCDWLNLQDSGAFKGNVFAFYGKIVDYTTPVKQYNVSFGKKNMSIGFSGDAEFVGRTGGAPDI
jgi:hypothetical protein